MIELSNKRVEEILHEETPETESLAKILRAVYTGYMRLYEKYFADIDALDDDKIAELRSYHEETKSLVKHYYMDIPLDICLALDEFEDHYSSKLLGTDWNKYLFDSYKEFRSKNKNEDKSEESVKAEFTEKNLSAFYYAMNTVFRDGFDTGSRTSEKVLGEITGLLFGQ